MKRMYNLRIDPETESKIETLKTVYGINTTSKLLRFLIDMHFRFWMEVEQNEHETN